tara:strand:+ start:268 stop:471 length:204 start_codon:yes stop_codon:yes gene_type:complete
MPCKVKVDKETCIGCGACEAVAPEVYKLEDVNGEQKAFPIKEDTDETEKAKEGEEVCPVDAIKLEES